MKEVEANKKAWGLLAQDHYLHFKNKLVSKDFVLNPIIQKELGDISGKKILHLQCNTGADSIFLARLGASVTGVDLAPENIHFARKLAEDFGMTNVDFIQSDVLKLMDNHSGQYDIVFTSDGAIGWLPDLKLWAKTVRHFLKPDGFFYVHDSHPLFLIYDEEAMDSGSLQIRYPYFKDHVEVEDQIGGYASDPKEATIYYWAFKLSDLINALASAGLFIQHMAEHDRCAYGMGGIKQDSSGLWYYPEFEGALPITLSLRAVIR
jgi:SAM-dependent methyltransferase